MSTYTDPTDTAGYTLAAYETAGWYRHSIPPIIGTVERDNRDGGHAGTFYAPTTTMPPADLDERRDLVQTVRNALADDDGRVRVPAARCLAAVRTLRGMRLLPADRLAREAVAFIPSDGTTPDHAPEPDAWTARQHETVAKRTRKGRTTVERKRVGIAPVRGDVDAMSWNGHDDAMSDRACLARSLAVAELRSEHVTDDHGRTVYGARRLRSGARVSFDVLHVANRHYPPSMVPPLMGTDVTSYEEIVTAPNGVDPARCRVAVSRSYTDDTVAQTGAVDIEGDRDVYASHTRKRVTFPTRRTLKRGRSRTGDPRDVTFYRPADAATGVRTTYGYWQRVTLCVAPSASTDYRYRGFDLVTRPRVQVRDRRGTRADRVKRAEAFARKYDTRTIGTVDATNIGPAGVAELLANVNRGERVNLKLADGTRAVTRSGAGLYATQYTRPNGKRATYRTRSAAAMATFVVD